MKQEHEDKMYIEIADVIAKQSKAMRAKVGAVIVKDHNIISFGFNGTPAGFDNCCETLHYDESGKPTWHTKPEVLHAESNAITKLAKYGGFGCFGATLYCTYSPCIDCAKMIVQTGIKRVVYRYAYRLEQGVELLKQAGIVCEQFNEQPDDYNEVIDE